MSGLLAPISTYMFTPGGAPKCGKGTRSPLHPSAHPPCSLGQGESNCKVNLALWESASLWEHVELSFGEEGELLADQLGGSLAPHLLLQLQALGGGQQAVDLHSEVLDLRVLGLQCKLPTAHRTSQVVP